VLPGIGRAHFQRPTQFPLHRRHQRLLPLRIQRAHAPHMPGEVSFGEELRRQKLFQPGGGAIRQGAGARKCVHEFFRRHQVSQAQPRKKGFTKTAGIDHAPGLIESLERG